MDLSEQNSVISEYLICTDSLSSLDSLKCISSSNNIIVEIQKQLKSLRDKNISIDFAFVRGHTGVLGNERADWLAKAATKRKIDIDVNIPKSFYKKITNERMMKCWNQENLISNKGSITKKFFPTINKRLSCHHFYTNYKLTQFLTGHGNFKSYLNKFNLTPSSFCDCNIGGEENVEHVILLCSKVYLTPRKKCTRTVNCFIDRHPGTGSTFTTGPCVFLNRTAAPGLKTFGIAAPITCAAHDAHPSTPPFGMVPPTRKLD
ncbi:uncharacterized protein TNCV_2746321 [Trichonephila clavipes]|nr:uncharacterized protein TNCV_2746321 [Trichonephila clavipes]